MSNFIEELKSLIDECYESHDYNCYDDDIGNEYRVDAALKHLDSLGENAKRMMQIGEVMDELVKLGFEFTPIPNYGLDVISICCMRNHNIYVGIHRDVIATSRVIDKCPVDFEYYYTSPTWQQDLLAKVRELIK